MTNWNAYQRNELINESDRLNSEGAYEKSASNGYNWVIIRVN